MKDCSSTNSSSLYEAVCVDMTTTQYCEYPAAVHLRELPQVENKTQLSLAGYVFVHVFPCLTSFVSDSDLIKF